MVDDGAVIKEIPVFLSQSLSQGLTVYQFPYRDGGLNPETANVMQCSIKENPHEIMLELERSTDSINYCLSRGEQIAINVDGKDAFTTKNPEDILFPKNVMDRQTFISKSYPELNFAVGVLHENELHLTPIDTVSLLRPSFKYLDKGDKRLKNEGKDNSEADISGEDEEEPKQIVVKFARQESEKSKKARERSFSHVSKMNAKETWYRANYYDRRTDKSEIEFSKLYCRKMNEKTTEMKIDSIQLLSYLSGNEEVCANSSHGDSLSALSKMPLVEKVKKFFSNARLMQFGQLINHLGCTSELQDFLKAVQQVAVLVQGCWVVQSDIIYSKEIYAGGVPASLMKRARDYILYLFTKNRTVTREKIQATVKLPSELIKQILEEMSQLSLTTREWEFLLPTDVDFMKSYPDVTQRQFIKWEMKHEQLTESFKNSDSALNSNTPSKHRRKSYRDSSFSSDNESGAENRRKNYQITGHKIRRTKKNSQSSSEVQPQNS